MPEPPAKRSYVSPGRQAKAQATRARIIDAAAALFLEQGYGRTSTASIARAAATSEASVFAAFDTKANLLLEVVRAQVVRDSDFPLRANPAWQVFAKASDKAPAIAEMARVVRRAHDRSWRLLAIAAAAAEDDETVAKAVARGAQGRHDDVAWMLRDVIGLDSEDLDARIDEVWTLISAENYRHLVVERSWHAERYEAWLRSLLQATLT